MLSIILAAGAGTRLSSATQGKHKALTIVRGHHFLEYPLAAMVRAGATRICIVVGHQRHGIMSQFGDRYGGVPLTYVVNDKYDFHACGYSLAIASDYMQGQEAVLVTEADTVMPLLNYGQLKEHPITSVFIAPQINRATSVVALGDSTAVSQFVYDPTHRDVISLVPQAARIAGESLQTWVFAGTAVPSLKRACEQLASEIGVAQDRRTNLVPINEVICHHPMRPIVVPGQWVNLNTNADLRDAQMASWLDELLLNVRS